MRVPVAAPRHFRAAAVRDMGLWPTSLPPSASAWASAGGKRRGRGGVTQAPAERAEATWWVKGASEMGRAERERAERTDLAPNPQPDAAAQAASTTAAAEETARRLEGALPFKVPALDIPSLSHREREGVGEPSRPSYRIDGQHPC